MQIGIDISRIATATRTGTEQYTYELLAALAQADTTTPYRLYCHRQPAHLPPLGANFQLRQIPLARLWTHLRLSAEVLQHQPDVLFVPAHVLPLATPLARRMCSVVTIHDMGYLRYPAAHTRAQRIYLRLSTLWSARVATRVIAISQATRADLAQLARIDPQRIDVVYHGVSPRFGMAVDPAAAARIQQISAGEPYLLYVGTVQPRKNLLRLIEALALVGRNRPTPRLLIAGRRGWLAAPIEHHAANLGIADRVVFTGYVADDDLPALYAGALAFLFPSLYEGFGMPVLEAMASGTPVLTARSSALPEVAGDAALLVDPHDTTAIAEGIRMLLDEPALRQALRQAGRARAAQFTWEACAAATRTILMQSATH
ncbi:MAG TPA: glycosyltransferase family 1 protein [Roseiflexaceae bacterium]|nr:glycosyltransferase family 1 protein [Roseiflexaceae bacterium]HMP39219.1 glycosyltransferase family 1 protein [Roseiflexaceae bacterium]